MLIKIHKNRSVSSSGTWGTKNENNYEILNFEFPEELEEYNKRIVYYLGNQKVWDPIIDNKVILTNAITTKESVKAYIWCTKSDEAFETDVDFRTQIFVMNFFENDNADGIVPTEEQVDGFNTMLTAMNAKIEEIDELETTIENAETQRQENEETRQENEETRQENESTRQDNEQTRQEQEAERERRTDEAISQITDMTEAYNQNAQEKTESFNTNAENKTSAFNSNATEKTTEFNTNAESKTSAFNDNATQKTTNFDNNANSKTTTFNENATSKTNDFNDNATQKTTAFNENAQAKTEAFDEHTAEITADIEDLQQEVEELSENMPWNTTEQGTEIDITDAAKYSRNKLELFGNTEQDNTKMTYKCDGTETGDYYLTYDSTDYYFTMPTITEGDILVFDTTDLKLYLADTEITTESTGTGTNLTFIPSPNPDYPQPIHIVTGNNSVGITGKNLCKSFANGDTLAQYQVSLYIDVDFEIGKKYALSFVDKSVGNIYYRNENFMQNQSSYSITTTGERQTYYFECKDNDKTKRTVYTPNKGYLILKNSTVLYNLPQFEDVQIEEVTSYSVPATSYEPYYHADYPINLGSLELCKIGNYQDYLYKENGNWYKKPNILKTNFSANTVISTATKSSNDLAFRFLFYDYCDLNYNNTLAKCSHYPSGKIVFKRNSIWNNYQTDTMIIHTFDDIFTSEMTVEQAKAKFHELYDDKLVFYTKMTQEPIEITDETLISQLDAIYNHLALVKGTNHITITPSDLEPYVTLNYMQDLPSKLDNLDSRLSLLE